MDEIGNGHEGRGLRSKHAKVRHIVVLDLKSDDGIHESYDIHTMGSVTVRLCLRAVMLGGVSSNILIA